MLKDVKKVYFLGKGIVIFNVGVISALTFGIVGKVIHTSSLVVLNSAGLLFEIDNTLGEWAEERTRVAGNMVSRGMFRGVDLISKLTLGSMGVILKESVKLPWSCSKLLLKVNKGIGKWATYEVMQCVEQLFKPDHVGAMPVVHISSISGKKVEV